MKKIIKKSVVELPKKTGQVSDTINVTDKVTNAPSINLVQQMVGVPTDGIIYYEGDVVPEGYEEVAGTDIYSRKEIKTNKVWIDGKPIYRKVIEYNYETANTQVNIKTGLSNVNEIISYDFYLKSGEAYLKYFGTDVSYFMTATDIHYTATSWTGTLKIIIEYTKTTDDASVLNLITFTINGRYYQAEYDMTWEEWVNSEYNTDDYYIVSGCVVDSDVYPVRLNGTAVEPRDVIISTAYTVSSCCFVAGTQVMTTLEGETHSIEEIKEGDSVVSYNIETGENYLTKVSKVIINKFSLAMALIEFANGSQLEMTNYHPIYTKDGWHSITDNKYNKLIVGDVVKTKEGWTEITNITLYTLDTPITTYTLAVNDFNEENDIDTNDNFYANNIVVHNATSSPC